MTKQHATLDDLQRIVNGYYCSMGIFWENVGNEKQKVLNTLTTCYDMDSVRKLVNQYI